MDGLEGDSLVGLSEKYYYGANYYPFHERREQWKTDFDSMKEAGVNYVRTGEIMNSWDRIEPRNNEFDFSWLDDFFDFCAGEGMQILLGTGTNAPPYWIHQEDPSVNVLSHTGRRFPNNATYGWACYNNPTFKKYAERYISTLVKRYKGHPALLAFQINNEIGYPFMPLGDGGLEYYCYCDHCKAEFRKWLKLKYVTLDNITHAWSWSTTTTVHNSYEDIEPPYVKPAAWSSVTRWLDWRLFQMEVMTNQVRFESRLIKALDVTHPTITNIFYLKSQDPMGVLTAIDQFEIAKHVDIVGYDLYPGSGNKLERKPEFSSMFFDHLKSVCRPLGKEYWLSEAEAGPIGGWILGPDHNTNSVDIMRNQLEALGHGARSILYQLFKEVPFQPLHWGGIVNLDGSKSSRFDACAKIGKLTRDHAGFLNQAKPETAKIAIFVSKENQIIMNGLNHENFYSEELRGVYKYYWKKGFTIDFVTSEHLVSGNVNQYNVIHFPFLAYLNDEIANGILTYVENGGHAVSSARFGYMDHYGWSQPHIPGNNLHEKLGYEAIDCESNDDSVIWVGDSKYECYHHRETLRIRSDVNVLATYDDLTPAVVRCTYGKGEWIYFSTHCGRGYLDSPISLIAAILDPYLENHGISPTVSLSCDCDTDQSIDSHTLESNGKTWLILTHYTKKKDRPRLKGSSVEIKIAVKGKLHRLFDLNSQKEVNFKTDEATTNFYHTFTTDEFSIFEYTRENERND